MSGFATALSEITLVLFTTLAPSGALAYVLMSLPTVLGRADDEQRRRLDKCSCLQLVVTMVGLVASATHLGNPSNALYVFSAVGKSPLSTEVFCAVVFLAMAGVYWLYSFAEQPRRRMQRAALVVIDVAALAFVASVAFAYNVGTIPSWSLPLVPASLAANALLGGPVLACLGYAVAGFGPVRGRLGCGMLALSAAALAVNVVLYCALGAQLGGMANEMASMDQLVPAYPAFVTLFAVLAAAGLTVAFCGLRKMGQGRAAMRTMVWWLSLASALVLLGLFVMRFTFYMSHMTIGLGV